MTIDAAQGSQDIGNTLGWRGDIRAEDDVATTPQNHRVIEIKLVSPEGQAELTIYGMTSRPSDGMLGSIVSGTPCRYMRCKRYSTNSF